MSWFSDAIDSVAGAVSDVVDTAGDAVGGVVDAAGDVVGGVVTPETLAIAGAIALAQPELAAFAATSGGAATLGSGLAEGWGLAEGVAAAEGAATVWSVADTLKATTLALRFYRTKERQDELGRKARAHEDKRMQALNRNYDAAARLALPAPPANPSPYDLSGQSYPRAATLPLGSQPPPTDLAARFTLRDLFASPLAKSAAIAAGVLLLLAVLKKPGAA